MTSMMQKHVFLILLLLWGHKSQIICMFNWQHFSSFPSHRGISTWTASEWGVTQNSHFLNPHQIRCQAWSSPTQTASNGSVGNTLRLVCVLTLDTHILGVCLQALVYIRSVCGNKADLQKHLGKMRERFKSLRHRLHSFKQGQIKFSSICILNASSKGSGVNHEWDKCGWFRFGIDSLS